MAQSEAGRKVGELLTIRRADLVQWRDCGGVFVSWSDLRVTSDDTALSYSLGRKRGNNEY